MIFVNLQNNDTFKKISDPQEKLQIFKDLLTRQAVLVCKGSGENLFSLLPESIDKNQHLLCHLQPESTPPQADHDNVVVQFNVGAEKYFAYTKISRRGQSYELDFAVDLYHVQRRQSYRVRIPVNYKSKIELIKADSGKVISEGEFFDLSGGGLRMILPHDRSLLKEGDRLECLITLGARPPLSLKCLVRHIRIQKKPKQVQVIGLQFTPISTIVENKLFALILELHRELFTVKSL